MSDVKHGSDERARQALVLAAEMADAATSALALVSEAGERAVVAEAEVLLKMAPVNIALEVAQEALREVRRPYAVRFDGNGEPEEQPAWWLGRLEGVLGGLVLALEEATRE